MPVTSELFDLTGKVAIITGSSRGIGRAIAHDLAAHGAQVVISSRKPEPCDAVAAEINAACADGPGEAIAIPANIGDKEALQALVDQTREAWWRERDTPLRRPAEAKREGRTPSRSAKAKPGGSHRMEWMHFLKRFEYTFNLDA